MYRNFSIHSLNLPGFWNKSLEKFLTKEAICLNLEQSKAFYKYYSPAVFPKAFGIPNFCHSGLSGIFQKDSRRAMLAGMTIVSKGPDFRRPAVSARRVFH